MHNKETNFNPTELLKLGLYKEGAHSDTLISANGSNGEKVKLHVTPVKVNGGTIFVPRKDQNEALKILFPPKLRGNI